MTSKLKPFVERRLAELNMNAFEAARRSGLERGFINDILQGKKTNIRGNNLSKLAKALNISVVQLIDGTEESALLPGMKEWIEKNPHTMHDEKYDTMEDIRRSYPKSRLMSAIAIYNLLKPGSKETFIEPRPTSFIQEDEFTRNLRINYAVVIYDGYMAPELNPGELALVDFNYPPVEGNNYLFKTESGEFDTEICIAKLSKYDSENWILRQWKIKEDIILPRAKWTSCHRIVGKIAR